MRRSIYYLGFLLVAACASHPKAEQQALFSDYWNCAFAAARPYITRSRIPAREAAMRAQAQCYGHYLQYKNAREVYSRSVVEPSGYQMASYLAGEAALEKKRYVTQRVTAWVEQSRQ